MKKLQGTDIGTLLQDMQRRMDEREAHLKQMPKDEVKEFLKAENENLQEVLDLFAKAGGGIVVGPDGVKKVEGK